jgi:trehalose synthase-fused probable maltokinase
MPTWQQLYNSRLQRACAAVSGAYFREERWFADRGIQQQLLLEDSIQFGQAASQSFLSFNLFRPAAAPGYFYFIPLLALEKTPAFDREHLFEAEGFFFYDGVSTPQYIELIEQLLERGGVFETGRGQFRFEAFGEFREPGFSVQGHSSNSLLFVTHRYLIKNYRRIYPGVNPELAINTALTRLHAEEVPAVLGAVSYRAAAEYTLGIIQQFIPNRGSGWEVWGELLGAEGPETEEELVRESYSLGATLAGMHQKMALIARSENRFQPFTAADLRSRVAKLTALLEHSGSGWLGEGNAAVSVALNQLEKDLRQGALGFQYRIHGDLHLEQVLKTEPGWKVIDFEGEPLKSIAERENYDSPLKDLASMLRSISYRVHTAGGGAEWMATREQLLVSGLINGYREAGRELALDFLPDGAPFDKLLLLFQLERALYECEYEQRYRPEWLPIPLRGLLKLVETITSPSGCLN